MTGARHGHGMGTAWARHGPGMGAAWARHAMYESAFIQLRLSKLRLKQFSTCPSKRTTAEFAVWESEDVAGCTA